MTVGTPGFVGPRLREAREARGLTVVSLSDIASVSRQAIYEYEAGRSSPSPTVLDKIAAAVNLPSHFFLLQERDIQRGTIFYRSMSSATKSARARAERRFTWLRDIVTYLSDFVALPEPDFPDLELPPNPLLLSDDEIEAAAEDLRSHWGLRDGPIANTVLLLENHGAVIARDRLGADTLDSLSEFAVDDRRPFIVVGTDKGSSVRWRFDVAHELGHIVLHGHVAPEVLSRPECHKQVENQAHRFASAFLLPLAAFGDDLFAVNLDTLRAIKPKWKTSIAMMIRRARDAHLLSEEAERRLWINMSRRGWRRSEPFDDELAVEEPRLLRRAFELVLDQGGQTPDDVVANLALPAADVEALSGLSPGFLSGFAPVSLLPQAADSPVSEQAEARVLRFPDRQREET